MHTRRTGLLRRVSLALAIGALVLPAVPATATATVINPNQLVATLGEAPGGDPGAGGTFSVTLDANAGTACYVLDVTLTDLATDPPTAFDIHSSMDDSVVLALGTTTDVGGHAAACVSSVPPNVISALFASPGDDYVAVDTANLPNGAAVGYLWYAYPTGQLEVHTKRCPPAIQSKAQLTVAAKATCLDVVLPANAITPPPGYTMTKYGGTATFDYHATDGKHLDATIAQASMSGGGTCNSTTKTCEFAYLPYAWTAGMGTITLTPTVLPARTRFGTATASESGGGAISVALGTGNAMMVDSTGFTGVAISVYLFQTPDTTAPTVGVPTVTFRTGGTLGSTAPVRLAWSASDSGSGLDHYAVQAQIDGVTKTLAAKVTTKGYNTTEAVGHTYRYRVIAYDKAGNHRTSAWTAVEHLVIRQDSYPSIVYSGGWAKQSLATASGGTVHFAKTATAAVKLRFSGRSIAWVAPKGPGRGSAKIYVDSKLVATVSLYGTSADRLVDFSQRWSTVGTHTIRVVVVGTAGHPRVDVDAFLVLN